MYSVYILNWKKAKLINDFYYNFCVKYKNQSEFERVIRERERKKKVNNLLKYISTLGNKGL